jgi:hypothetical protein
VNPYTQAYNRAVARMVAIDESNLHTTFIWGCGKDMNTEQSLDRVSVRRREGSESSNLSSEESSCSAIRAG